MDEFTGYDETQTYYKFRYYVARLTLKDPTKPWPTPEYLHATLSVAQKSLRTWCEMPEGAGRTDRLVKLYAAADHPMRTWRRIVHMVGLLPSNENEDRYFSGCTKVPSMYHDRNFPIRVNLTKIPPMIAGAAALGSAGGAGAGAAALGSAGGAGAGGASRLVDLHGAGGASRLVDLHGAGGASRLVDLHGAGGASRFVDAQAPALDQLAAAAASVSLPPCPVAVPRPAPASEVQKLNKEIETLLGRIAVLTQTNGRNDRELTQAKSSNADLQGLLVAKDARISDLEKQVRTGASEATALQNQVTMTDAHRTTAEARVAELEPVLAQRDARIAELEPVLAQRDARIAELETTLAKARKTIDIKTERAKMVGSNVRALKRKLAVFEAPPDEVERVQPAENNGGAAGAP